MGKSKVNPGCDGKIKHISESAASQSISLQNKESVQSYYLCNKCKQWHVYTIPGTAKLFSKRTIAFAKRLYKAELKKMKYKRSK